MGKEARPQLCLNDVVNILGAEKCRVYGDKDMAASMPAPLLDGAEGGFSFHDAARLPDMKRVLSESKSTIILTNFVGPMPPVKDKTVVVVPESRKAYIKVLDAFFRRADVPAGIQATTQVHPQAVIHASASIGHHCVIGRCTIGKQVLIENNVVIGGEVVIGNRVRIKSGTVIGNDGFSFARDEDGHLMRFVHFGGVLIEDDVEIGSNTAIDRGTFGNTIVGEGTKIDNLCHIAHNVQIGKHCVIIAGTVLSGSDILGDRVWVSPGVTIRDVVSIGNDAFIGMGSVVIRNVKDGGRVFGNPAAPIP